MMMKHSGLSGVQPPLLLHFPLGLLSVSVTNSSSLVLISSMETGISSRSSPSAQDKWRLTGHPLNVLKMALAASIRSCSFSGGRINEKPCFLPKMVGPFVVEILRLIFMGSNFLTFSGMESRSFFSTSTKKIISGVNLGVIQPPLGPRFAKPVLMVCAIMRRHNVEPLYVSSDDI